jgi:UDP-4-amino-4-deoxy-L-arabinose formyltransferase/UDP-glucuronic acid dehydrogenase (UDP-4-keto-hexauronic acid decarboxylating)
VNRLRAVVFAYHNMGIIGIRSLLDCGFDVPMVFSHADDPKENRWFGSVAEYCRDRGIPVHMPEKVNQSPWPEAIREAGPDLIFSFYYRSMLGREILAIPRLCAMNLHGSLLPRYRGRAPVNWVLVNGETETGVTLHVMTEKPDAGDIVAQAAVPIAFEDTALSLYGKMEKAAGSLLAGLLPRIAAGDIPRRRNELEKGSYYGGRKPDDGRIDWSRPAVQIYNLVRAVTRPYPGAFALLGGEKFLVWWALPVPAGGFGDAPAPGKLMVAGGASSLRVAGGCLTNVRSEKRVMAGTGDGLLQLEEVEWKGKSAKGEAIASFLANAIAEGFE